jgi:periplasmic protein TonB
MVAPLRSANPGPAKAMQFSHFGVLDTGGQSKASTATSLVINLLAAFVIVVISAAATRQTIENNKRLTQLTIPIVEKKVEPVKPKMVPPKQKLPQLAKVEPRIKLPPIKVPEAPKQPTVKMEAPKPILIPAAPKQVIAMAAPKVVNLGHPEAASVPNHDAHPSAVGLGHPDSPISNLHGPAVAPVNMGQGFPGMNSANNGHGPAAAKVNLGNGSPEGTSIKGNGVVAVAGIPHGVPGGTGTGPGNARVAGTVNLGHNEPPPMPKPVTTASAPQVRVPKVIYKPKPVYTAEAKQLHLEGTVTVHIRVLPSGAVEVIGVTNGLGHGLDESAERAVLATKFEPATDASGHPITWDGVVNVAFQLAG